MTSRREPIASLSFDLDDKWTYLKTHGDPGWSAFPTYLDVLVPRVLDFLERRSLRLTFFVVGQDADLPRNAGLLRSISKAGHEVGNHSFHHEPWLHIYSKAQLESEIKQAEECIEIATGQKPRGFRGPGYSFSDTVAEVLVARGYMYDASTLPTFLGPLARAWYLATAELDLAEKRRRAKLFGCWQDGFRPLKPYEWHTPSGKITEIPVTTMPVLRVPFHTSYLIYLLNYSEKLAHMYLQMALSLCRASGVQPSLLLHPLDFLKPEEAPELAFFPGMRLPLEQKLELVDFTIQSLAASHGIVTVGEHASAERARIGHSSARVPISPEMYRPEQGANQQD
jgi:peptidoglycan-N-acetylglucosamine deacetylase